MANESGNIEIKPHVVVHPALRSGLIISVATALVALLGFLYLKSQGVDYRLQSEILGYLRELKEIDNRWDTEVLRARSQDVVGDIRLLRERDARVPDLQRRLRQAAGAISSPALASGLPALTQAFDQKFELLEKYRAANGEISRLLQILSRSDSEVAGLVRGAWPVFPQRDRLVAVESTSATLSAHVMRYVMNPAEPQRKNVEAFAADLREAGAVVPPALREGLARLDSSVQQILGAKPVEEALYLKLSTASAGPRIDSLTDAFTNEIADVQSESERYRTYLSAYAGALLILIGYLLSRLAISYRLLNEANRVLESRVEERTRELSSALRHLQESEMQLIQTEKMSSLGQMVAGIAHEINTPLAYVKNSLGSVADKLPGIRDLVIEAHKLLQLMASNAPDPQQLQAQYTAVHGLIDHFAEQQTLAELGQLAKDGLYGINEISEIVVNLKDFSRLDRSSVSSFNLNEGLESALLLAKHEIKHLSVRKQFGDIPQIVCAPSQINQVFLNLINNAAQAIESGDGEITLSTRMDGPDHVAIEVADNGKGIPPEILPKIFDPFFTTKDVGKGTGLGLSIAYKIIERHGGKISVDSLEGRGTRFLIVLPLQPPVALESKS